MKTIILRIIFIIAGLLAMYLWSYLAVNYEFRNTWWVFPTEFICVTTMIGSGFIVTAAGSKDLQELIDAFKEK